MQINLLVSTALAGRLLDAGSISYIYYADRLNQLPLGLIGIGLGTILLPTISRMLNSGQEREAMDKAREDDLDDPCHDRHAAHQRKTAEPGRGD